MQATKEQMVEFIYSRSGRNGSTIPRSTVESWSEEHLMRIINSDARMVAEFVGFVNGECNVATRNSVNKKELAQDGQDQPLD